MIASGCQGHHFLSGGLCPSIEMLRQIGEVNAFGAFETFAGMLKQRNLR